MCEITSDAILEILNESEGYYSEAYSELFVHEIMLKDKVRTMAYKRAIELNKHLFKDKIVLDIGCGTGILSMFAASAGARTVIAVDASDIAKLAKKIVAANKFDNIHVIQSKVEKLEKLPLGIEHVDIIISEWMGICLFQESMLTTVVYARDRWLTRQGLIFPDQVKLYLCAVEHDKKSFSRIHSWRNVYGFDMSVLKPVAGQEAVTELIPPENIVTNSAVLIELDLMKCDANFSFETEFCLSVQRNDYVHVLATYFDTIFSKGHIPIVLSTSPFTSPTHWKQTLFFLDRSLHVREKEEIRGNFKLDKYKNNFRDLAIEIEISMYGAYSSEHFSNSFLVR